MMLPKTFAGRFQRRAIAGCLLCTTRHWCAFSFHANRLSSFIFLTSSSYASDELGLLQILLKCTGNPPTPLQPKQKKKRKKKHKNTRVVVCKPVIYSAFALLGPANGIMDRKSPLHFNLDVLQPLPGSCVRPDGTCWSVPLLFSSIMGPRLCQDALWPCNDLQLRWCRSHREMELERRKWGGAEKSPEQSVIFGRTSMSIQMSQRIAPQGWEKLFSEGRRASAWEGLDRWNKSGICSHCLWRFSLKTLLSTLSSSFNFNFCSVQIFSAECRLFHKIETWKFKGHCLCWGMSLIDAAVAFFFNWSQRKTSVLD